MKMIKWSKELETGIQRVDFQHQVLILAIQDLANATESSSADAKTILTTNLNSLKEYTITHFTDEEDIMNTHQYEFFPDHLKLHQHFKSRILSYIDRCNAGEVVLQELVTFLSDWLVHHIEGDDMKMAKALGYKK
jgi:hemerythrin-like metal-binding protein